MRDKGNESSKSDYYKLSVKEFKFSQKKQYLLKVSGLARLGNFTKLKEFVMTLNKKQEVLPWGTILQRIVAADRLAVGSVSLAVRYRHRERCCL